MPKCGVCQKELFANPDVICDDCEDLYCSEHVDPEEHDCDGGPEEIEDGDEEVETEVKTVVKEEPVDGNGGRMIAGAILLVGGAAISITGIGAIVGIPLGMLGFGFMFPRLTATMAVLAIIAFFGGLVVVL